MKQLPLFRGPDKTPFKTWRVQKYIRCWRKVMTTTVTLSIPNDRCKDNTSKDPFSQCENLQNLQGIHIQVKSEHVGTVDNK